MNTEKQLIKKLEKIFLQARQSGENRVCDGVMNLLTQLKSGDEIDMMA